MKRQIVVDIVVDDKDTKFCGAYLCPFYKDNAPNDRWCDFFTWITGTVQTLNAGEDGKISRCKPCVEAELGGSLYALTDEIEGTIIKTGSNKELLEKTVKNMEKHDIDCPGIMFIREYKEVPDEENFFKRF